MKRLGNESASRGKRYKYKYKKFSSVHTVFKTKFLRWN